MTTFLNCIKNIFFNKSSTFSAEISALLREKVDEITDLYSFF